MSVSLADMEPSGAAIRGVSVTPLVRPSGNRARGLANSFRVGVRAAFDFPAARSQRGFAVDVDVDVTGGADRFEPRATPRAGGALLADLPARKLRRRSLEGEGLLFFGSALSIAARVGILLSARGGCCCYARQ